MGRLIELIRSMLKTPGRAALALPDNSLYEAGLLPS